MRDTKKSLLISSLSLLMCCSMLISTTFAWFTDSVTSSNNIIKTGELNIDLLVKEDDEYVSIKDTNEAIFDYKKWEPGYVEVANLKLATSGTLSLQYMMKLIPQADAGELSKVIEVYYAYGNTETLVTDREKLDSTLTKVGTLEEVLNTDLLTGKFVPGTDTEEYITIAFKLPENAGNEYQGLSTCPFDIKVFATQVPSESDSFDDQYDVEATYDYEALKVGATNEEVVEALNGLSANQVLYLTSDTADLGTLELSKDARINLAGNTFIADIKLDNCTLELINGELAPVTVTGTGTLVLNNVNIEGEKEAMIIGADADITLDIENDVEVTGGMDGDAIQVSPSAALTLTGKGELTAIGNEGYEYLNDTYKNTDNASYKDTNGSGIGNTDDEAGTIVIDGLAHLTAEGYGKAAFGIGGNIAELTIKNTTIDYVRGGFAEDELLSDKSYGKSEAEGGAAIGSMLNNAVINLENVVIEKAEGGSKAAAIGGRYWTAITVNITDSTLKDIIGGNCSAAIGGSRIKKGNDGSQTTTINIHNSTIKAQGGEFGAGIGSGYDTYCSTNSPITTINITGDSVITAKGGRYAAGIGTGYHVGGLAGKIESSVIVNASAPDVAYYKDAYSTAQAVGYGVVDPAREGLTAINCTFDYQGTNLVFPGPTKVTE